MKTRPWLSLSAALLMTVAPAYAGAASSSPGTGRVSGNSPYAACAAADPNDTLFPNAEVEPDVSSNPARPGNLVAVWQQDRWAGGGAHGLMAGYSFDGGKTWANTTLPFSKCAPNGLNFTRASDPAVSIGPDGTAYAIGLSFNPPETNSAITSAVSTNGGRTWQRVRVIATDDPGLVDKEWITADPTQAGTAYAVWDDLNVTPDGHFTSPAFFSKTRDYGRTWSKPKPIAASGPDEQAIGNQIMVDRRTGRLYDTYQFNFCTCPSIPKIAYVYSDDGGSTWSRQRVISDSLGVGVTQPGTQFPVRSGGLPFAAIARSGQLYVIWQDSRFSGGSYDEIAIATTTDRGAHWTTPRRANKPTGRAAFTPSIAVTRSGRAGITYYDLRADTLSDNMFSASYWATTTKDARHFVGDEPLTPAFDLLAAPNAGGLFVGDYQGLTAVRNHFVSVFVKTNCGGFACADNSTDVYSARFGARPGSSRTAVLRAAAAAPSPQAAEPQRSAQPLLRH
jgi:hypothetical protein